MLKYIIYYIWNILNIIYFRTILKLTHPTAIQSWTTSVNGEPGFFTKVFQALKTLSLEDKECSLLLDV